MSFPRYLGLRHLQPSEPNNSGVNYHEAQKMKYKVRGYAFIPIEVAMDVEANNPEHARLKAVESFRASDRKSRFVVPGTEDEAAVFDWEPCEAKPVE